MIETEFVLADGVEAPRVSDGVLIEGLPGIGLVAKVAVSYVIKQLDVKHVCRIFSPHFPSVGYVSEGKIIFSFADIYYASKPLNLFLLYGNSQPSTSFGQHDFCDKVVRFAKDLGCNTIITLGGYGKESVSELREIYCSSTDPDTLEEWTSKVGGVRYAGQIVGAAGLLAVLAAEHNMKNFAMLVETAEMIPDFYAARRAIEALNKLLDLGINVPTADELSRIYVASVQELETF
ncbi:MAG: PAC2 family protein [Aigarchaeota archaeon]|nr:PAC2 family protein [Candidatus Pelearchaeum maunauluense]